MRPRATFVFEPLLRLCPPIGEPVPPAVCARPPSRGQFTLHGFECRVVRRCDGILGCYVQVPRSHELYGRTDLSELSLTLDCPEGVTYSAGGAQGWFIGSAGPLCWDDAYTLLDDLTRQLAEFAPREQSCLPPRVRRVSGIKFKAVGDGEEDGEEDGETVEVA